MIKYIVRKINKGIRNPEQIIPYLDNRKKMLSYYSGDGSRAMLPQVIKLYVNAICNAHCVMCDVGQMNRDSVFYQQVMQSGDDIFSVDDCRRLMEDIKGFKPEIHIHGLEPLLHPNFLELISVIKQQGLYIHLITNGILLAPMTRGLIELGVDRITVSLDGLEHIHDQIRGSGIFEKAIEGIRLLRYWRSQFKKDHVKITTTFTISNWNYHNLKEYADKMLNEEEIDAINFLHLSYVTEEASKTHNDQYGELGKSSAVNIKIIDPEKIDTDLLWNQIKYLKGKYDYNRVYFNHEIISRKKLDLFLKNPDRLVSNAKCKIPWKKATILANGDMIINNRCFTYKTGNLHRHSFNEIWNGECYRVFRRELKKAGYFPACIRCCCTYSE